MREIMRLALTVAVVGIASGLLLFAVNHITEPIIAQRIADEYLQAVREYFPEVAEVEKVELDEIPCDLIYDGAGNLIGVMATVGAPGYDGTITYNLAVDGAGRVVGIRIVSHTETPGIGDVIEKPDFLNQFIGKGPADPLQAGVDVDLVSGATVSTSAMINSVRRAVGEIAVAFLGFEEDVFDIAAVPDGTYQGTAPGFKSDITVEVVVEGGRIVSIEVLEWGDTPTYFVLSDPLIPERIIEEQKLEVDTRTGATISAEGIVKAVRAALSKGLEEGGGEDDA